MSDHRRMSASHRFERSANEGVFLVDNLTIDSGLCGTIEG
jgi:hypothetical protein